ncbi:hypothetical protein [Serinicoccus chungangensis]|uniref:hypothetical protein n=1 Tax=Serinicoccus chungangensis TaxID=767452 RepID=UPI001305335D|nr:hypothetical protein [Serinicoccus chungangensis]
MSPRKSGTDAWGRWGWLFGAIWLVFFAFPVTYIWTTDGSMAWRVTSTAVVVAFMAAYVVTVRLSTHLVAAGEYARAARGGMVGLAAMVATALVLAVLIGPNSLTALPFIVAVPVFFLPWRAMWTTSLTLFALGVVTSTVAWGLPRSVMLWGIALLAGHERAVPGTWRSGRSRRTRSRGSSPSPRSGSASRGTCTTCWGTR